MLAIRKISILSFKLRELFNLVGIEIILQKRYKRLNLACVNMDIDCERFLHKEIFRKNFSGEPFVGRK